MKNEEGTQFEGDKPLRTVEKSAVQTKIKRGRQSSIKAFSYPAQI